MDLVAKVLLQIFAVGAALLGYTLDYVTTDKRTNRFKRNRWLLFTLSGVLLLASIAVVIVDDRRDQEAKHALELQLERARQPIRDVFLSYRLDIPLEHPALKPYVSRVQRAIDDSLRTGQFREGLYVSRQTDGKLESVGLPTTSGLYPKRDTEPLPHFLLNYVGLEVNFYRPKNARAPDPRGADFSLAAHADVDVSVPVFRSPDNPDAMAALHIDARTGTPFVEVTNWRIPPQWWRSNGTIQSLPDLLAATMSVRYRGFASSGHSEVVSYLSAIQKDVRVNFVELNVAGRRLRFGQKELSAQRDATGIYFVAPVSAAKDPGA